MRCAPACAFALTLCAIVGSSQTRAQPSSARASRHLPSHPGAADLRPLTQRERALQLLNRFTFGPRPGDVEHLLSIGVDRWLEAQLAPSSIPDPVLAKRLVDYPTLGLSPAESLTLFPDTSILRQTAEGKLPLPQDPELKAVYEVELLKYARREERRKLQAASSGDAAAPKAQVSTAVAQTTGGSASALPDFDDDSDPKDNRHNWRVTAERLAGDLLVLPREERMPALLKLRVEDRATVTTFVAGDRRATLLRDFTPHERELFYALSSGPGNQSRIDSELSEATVLRDILSERQLEAVMTAFWFNHFNVYMGKGADRWYTASYLRDAIRPHALGHFRDLLMATAESPAMMVYLDNLQSIGPDSPANAQSHSPDARKGLRGLNENYGRELMELHTLSVAGGYTQADVTALAAVFTGWSVDSPQLGGPFRFDQRRHEPGDKFWLGHTLHEGRNPDGTRNGMLEGIEALQTLAASPKTAQFISMLLAQRFVADTPPPALVDRLTSTYLTTDGDIKAILRVLAASPEFNTRRYFRNQVKTPLEFVTSVFRATASEPSNPAALVGTLRSMGMPLFLSQPPTGYNLTADHWMNSAAIVDRLAFAEAFTSGRYANQKFDASRLLAIGLLNGPDPRPATDPDLPVGLGPSRSSGSGFAFDVLAATILGKPLDAHTALLLQKQEAVLAASAAPAGPDPLSLNSLALYARILLSSPAFQLR